MRFSRRIKKLTRNRWTWTDVVWIGYATVLSVLIGDLGRIAFGPAGLIFLVATWPASYAIGVSIAARMYRREMKRRRDELEVILKQCESYPPIGIITTGSSGLHKTGRRSSSEGPGPETLN